jgi:hypothetical protein
LRTALSCLIVCITAPISAQAESWDFDTSLYAWLPALSTSVDTRFGEIDADSSDDGVVLGLEMAFMGTFQAHRGRWGFIADVIYADVTASQDTPFGLEFSEAEVDTKVLAFSGYLSYQVFESKNVAVELLGGFRVFDVALDVELKPGNSSGESTDVSDSWVDPLLGAKALWDFNDAWFGTAAFDFGGLSSTDNTWQLLATVGYRFNERWTSQLGYRHMVIEKPLEHLDTSLYLSGPLLGVSASF